MASARGVRANGSKRSQRFALGAPQHMTRCTGNIQTPEFDLGDALARPYRPSSPENLVLNGLATTACGIMVRSPVAAAPIVSTFDPHGMVTAVIVTVVVAVCVMTAPPATGMIT